MYSSGSFQTSLQEATTSSMHPVENYFPDSVQHELYPFFGTDSISDSLSPCSHSSLSGDEESYSVKRRRSYNSLPLSPMRFKDDLCSIADEVMRPHSPESGIAPSPPMNLYTQNPNCWIEIVEQPEEYYRARYASEGSRGPLKGRSHNSHPKVKLIMEGNKEHVSATVTVSLVHNDNTPHSVCSLATAEEDGPSNVIRRVTCPDFTAEFEQLRVKRERSSGGNKRKNNKAKSQKQNEAVGFLLFKAEITTANGLYTCQARSDAIKLTAKQESAELHAIKNECGSVEGGEEVWIRGSKMIGTPSVYFEIYDPATKRIKQFSGTVMREECHQNLMVVKTPRVPYNEAVVAKVVMVTGKDKLRSNTLQFTFIPSVVDRMLYHNPPQSSMECMTPYSRLSPCYSPQPSTPSSVGCVAAEDDLSTYIPSTPPANALEGLLDVCVQQLDQNAEEKFLLTAALPEDPSSLAVQELDEKALPTVVLSSDANPLDLLNKNDNSILPPTILLPTESVVHQRGVTLDININVN